MPKGRAIRRTHRQRIKNLGKFWWGRKLRCGAELGRIIDTPTPCSCWMCGNPRRYFKDSTVSERRWLQEVGDESQ